MKKQKRNFLLVALIVILLAIAVGYAAFSANITISGTATASGTWDVKFLSASVDTSSHGTANVTGNKNDTLSVSVTLGYPGDGCTVTANIQNAGTVPAKLTGFTLTDDQGKEFSNSEIEITTPTITTDGSEVIAAGGTCPVTFGIKWKKDSTTTTTTTTAKFKINFTYEQATNEVTVTPTHGVHTK